MCASINDEDIDLVSSVLKVVGLRTENITRNLSNHCRICCSKYAKFEFLYVGTRTRAVDE